MTSVTTKPDPSQPTGETAVYLFDNWFDPIEAGLRDRAREFIHAMIEGELDMALSRPRYARHAKSPSGEAEETVGVTGHRHGHRSRSLMGSFGRVEIEVPRARLNTPDGKTTEWKSKALRAYQRRTLVADALIAGAYLAGTNTRRVRRTLASLFGGAVGKDTVSRVWRKVKTGLSEFLCVRRFPSCEHEALFEHNGELRLRLEPLARRPFPVRSRVIQDQI